MSEPFDVNIHPECFKLLDPRIQMLVSGKLPVHVFLSLLTKQDPFVLIDDTLYVLSEREYYASMLMPPVDAAIQNTFQAVMKLEDLQFMQPEDKDLVQRVKKELPTCPSCRYKRYRNQIYELAKRYGIAAKDTEQARTPYPAVKQPVKPIVSHKMQNVYRIPFQVRKSCYDCVLKHVSQAWVLGRQILMGYPEHLGLLNAHLGQAIEESPQQAQDLRDTLIFCQAKTNHDGYPFVPLSPLVNHLDFYKAQQTTTTASTEVQTDSMQLELTEGMKEQLRILDHGTLEKLDRLCRASCTAGPVQYTGYMGCIADTVLDVSRQFANMVRNRRLIFCKAPELAAQSGYDMKDVSDFLAQLKTV